MQLLYFLAASATAYCYASINLAVIIGRFVKGIDIRDVGTGAAGTANTARYIGIKWAVLVFFFDISKGLLPLLISRNLFIAGDYWNASAVLFGIGIVSIIGHCRPIFYQFRGGGGIAAAIGILLFFSPAEFVISALLAYFIVSNWMKTAEYRLGQWVPILFLIFTPLITFALSFTEGVELIAGIRLGGKPRQISIGILAVALVILVLNPQVARRKKEEKSKTAGED